MGMYDGWIDMLMSPAQRKRRDELEKARSLERAKSAVPWDPNIKWQPELTIQARTYKPLSLFDVSPSKAHDVNDANGKETKWSPKLQFCYVEKRLKLGDKLQTVNGQRKGDVMWDGPVTIPCLHERSKHMDRWEEVPWMSLTPMEILTMRSGTKRAKGRTIVAGLGLGYQLIEVSKRPQVRELVLVEQSRDLVDWLLPRIEPHLGCKLADVVVGDAYKKLPKMTADVALIDIFKGYGFNSFTRWVPDGNSRGNREEPVPTPGIKSVWCWGGVQLRD